MDDLNLDLRDFEYMVSLTNYAETDTYVMLIGKVGGGTYGQKYSGKWVYVVLCNGKEIMRGHDFECGLPLTYREVAMQIISFHTDNVTEFDFQHTLAEKRFDYHTNGWVAV